MNDHGPEDDPKWTKMNGENHTQPVSECGMCGTEIKFWHCADAGCPWCAVCGTNARDIREKRKNGTD